MQRERNREFWRENVRALVPQDFAVAASSRRGSLKRIGR